MEELSKGQAIILEDGSKVTVVKFLGEGGQGVVYLVADSVGNNYALKWYTNDTIINSDPFHRNLLNNIKEGAPTDAFLWPLKATKKQFGSYGYIMKLRPNGFNELGDFFSVDRHPEARFPNFMNQILAALHICNGFRTLHIHGYSYQDLNEGNFFINPQTGEVLICDNDNVVANGRNLGVGGKVRYMAPEVVNGKEPNIQSDCLSLAIILYRLFLIDHPFEGKKTLVPCLTPEKERELFGNGAVFCFDKGNAINRPHPVEHPNSLLFWNYMPQSLKVMFQRALSKECLLNPNTRIRDKEWKELFLQLRRDLVVCPAPPRDKKDHDFMTDGDATTCLLCKKSISTTCLMKFKENGAVYRCFRHKHLYLGDSLIPVGYGLTRKKADGQSIEIAIRNDSKDTWTIITASKKMRKLAPSELMPLRTNMQIMFNNAHSCEVIIP